MKQIKPLELDKVSEATCARLETLFDRNAQDNLSLMKKLFEEVKLEAVEVVNKQIAKFREVKQLGELNFFNHFFSFYFTSGLARTKTLIFGNYKDICALLEVYSRKISRKRHSIKRSLSKLVELWP